LQRKRFPEVTARALAAALVLAAAQDAHAQSSEAQKTVTAQALYEQAVAAMDQKNYASACPTLEDVVRLVPGGIGAKLTLAECYEADGRLASAWTAYAIAESAAGNAGQLDRQQKAHARAEALKPRLARLTLVVPAATRALPGLEITRDGVLSSLVQWGLPLPVDRGKHVVVVTAPGKERWETTFEVKEDGAVASVNVPVLLDASKPRDDAKVTAPVAGMETETKPPTAQRTAGIAVGAVGVAAVGVSAALGALAIGKKNESNEGHCHDGNQCDAAGIALRSQGLTFGNASTALFIGGAVALVGGVVLFATGKSEPKPAVGRAISPAGAPTASLMIGPRGFTISGAF
jgi:hypothetical protein